MICNTTYLFICFLERWLLCITMVTLWSHQCPKNGIYEVSEQSAQKKEWLCYAIFERCAWGEPQHLFLRTRGSGVRIPPGVPTENRLTVRFERFFLYPDFFGHRWNGHTFGHTRVESWLNLQGTAVIFLKNKNSGEVAYLSGYLIHPPFWAVSLVTAWPPICPPQYPPPSAGNDHRCRL